VHTEVAYEHCFAELFQNYQLFFVCDLHLELYIPAF